MICPECRGRGVVRKRLLFFTWRHRCWKCGGTGQLGPGRMRDDEDRYDDRRDDFLRGPTGERSSAGDRETFDVGSGGRSGGAGGGAGWDDAGSPGAGDRDQPVIVDPFAAEVVAAEASGLTAEASASESDAGSDSGSSGDAGSSSEGTSY